MLTWRDVWNYLRVIIKWWWVPVLAVVLSAGVAYAVVSRQPRYYVAKTTLMVGDTLNSITPDEQLIGLSSALANFYAEIARRELILGPVVEQLGLNFGWQQIQQYMLGVTVNQRASLLDISITDTSPQRAAAIAAAIADELVRYSPNSPEKVAAQRALIQEQIQQSQRSLEQIERNIEETQDMQTRVTGAADLREVRNRLEELQRTRDSTQETYNQLIRLQNSSVANTLNVFDPAQIPSEPIPDKKLLTVAMAGGGGLALALIAVFLLEFLDDRWRGGGDLRARFGMAFLGHVPGREPLIDLPPANALLREAAVRETHTQIVLAAVERGTHLLMISSPAPSEARSAFTVDLAQSFTRSGYRVLLVDADMDQSFLTTMIGEPQSATRPAVILNGDVEVWTNLQQTRLKNVFLMARNQDPDGRPMTPSLPWPDLVQSVNRVADVIIFDGPSALRGVDAALLSPLVDGIVLTVDPNYHSGHDVQESKHRLTRSRESQLLGAVILTDTLEPITGRSGAPWKRNMIAGLLGPGASEQATQQPAQTVSSYERPIVTPPPGAEDEATPDEPHAQQTQVRAVGAPQPARPEA
jgi:capsular polysaccharide biosynthesis protein/Mrp family chromosome partitioning ATPase